jgi:hypothetical protein
MIQIFTEAFMADTFGSMASIRNKGLLTEESDSHYRIERNFLVTVLAPWLAKIKFDEAWYLNKYGDVRDAVKRGTYLSGREHYLTHGFLEHRLPSVIPVNEKWYLQSYPDVADAIRTGVYKSAQAHFDLVGFREGRLPFAKFQF